MMERFLNNDEVDLLMGLTHTSSQRSPSVESGLEGVEWKITEEEIGVDPKLLAILYRVRDLALLPPTFQPAMRMLHLRPGEAERPQLYVQPATVIRVFLVSAEH